MNGWDLIALIIIGISIYVGVKRGFIRSIMSVFCYVLSFGIGRYFSPTLANMAYDNFLGEKISIIISQRITIAINSGAINSQEVAANLPGWITGIMDTLNVDFIQPILDLVMGQVTPEMIDSVALNITNSISDIIIEFLSWLFFTVIFMVSLFILKKLSGVLTFVDNIPIVGSLNMLLGGATGIVTGLLFVMVVGALGLVIGVMSGGKMEFFSQQTIESSLIIGTLKRLLIK